MTLSKCVYGGGAGCVRHGGSGSLKHGSAFSHRFEEDSSLQKSNVDAGRTHTIKALEAWFDDSVAEEVLKSSVPDLVNTVDVVRKSLYDFDVQSIEGIDKIIYLLPVLDEEVVKFVAKEVWPGLPVDEDTFDAKKTRIELKWFLMDFIHEFEARFNTTGTGLAQEPAGQDGAQEPAPEAGVEQPDDSEAPQG